MYENHVRPALFTRILFLMALLPAWAHGAIPPEQRQALLDLYTGTNGANWTISTGWNGASGTECSWFGVTCDGSQSNVTGISLIHNNLNGTIPASVANVLSLRGLSLNNNDLGGAIPPLTNLTSLQSLILDDNQLSGTIPSLTGLTSLLALSLQRNALSGSIPSLAGLTSLRSLLLDDNQLSGTIPSLTGLTSLSTLSLQRNALSGSVPSLAGLTSLQALFLDVNQLSGSIPPLAGLTSLQDLWLSRNQLSGTIPSLAGLTSLRVLLLDENQLNGNIPSLTGLTSLEHLWLRGNQLSGTIPSLAGLTSLQSLFLNDNQLSGAIPSLTGLASLEYLYLEDNQLSGTIPPLSGLTSLQFVYLSDNQLSGAIPSLTGLPVLRALLLANNQLSGSIPPLTGLPFLLYLQLDHNQLTGTIPPLTGLTLIQNILLSNNQLSGAIPPLTGLVFLRYLVLNDNLLAGSLPDPTGLPNLSILLLHGNMLSGPIPSEYLNVTTLDVGSLDLRWNALYSSDPSLVSFLNSRQNGGDWQSSQTIAPVNVTADPVSSTSITLGWTPIAYTADSGFYRALYATTSGGPYTPFGTVTANKSASSVTVTGLAPTTTYYFVVQTTTQPHGANANTVSSEYSLQVAGTTSGSAPTANVSGSRSICAGASAQIQAALSGTPPWNVTWSDGFQQNGVSGSPAIRTVSPATTTTYTVTTISNAGGSAAGTGNAVITVNPIPATPAITAPLFAIPNQVGLSASVPLNAGSTYAWTITGSGTITSAATGNAITFTAGAAGSLTLQVTETRAGCASGPASKAVSIRAGAAPTIESITPSSGPTAGGTAVSIAGTGFQAGATVRLGGVLATNVVVVNATTITASTPSRGAGAVDLEVRNPGAPSVTLGHGFSFVSAEAPLTVQSVSPNHGSTAGGEVVTVSGTGFQAGAAVLFGGTAGTTVGAVNATTLTVKTPARCAGPVAVTVSSGGTAASLLDGFRYSGAPVRIDAVSPATGRAGDIVSIRGFGLDPVSGVTFNGVESTAVTVQGNGTIVKCVVPQASGLAIPVSVTVAGAGTAIGTFSYTEAPSTPFLVTSVAPSAGPFGGGNTVTITGTGFQSGATVSFGASQATNVIVLDSTKITATVPSLAPASEPVSTTVSVVNPGAKAAGSAGAYTYSPTGGGCVTAGLTQCVGGSRFALQVTWKNPYDGGTVGVGAPVPMTSDTGSYWFFDDQNTELVVKVLDGRAANGSFWVFYGALSDVEYDLTVTDTVTGAVKSYRNAPRNLGSVADTKAFPVGSVYQPCENP